MRNHRFGVMLLVLALAALVTLSACGQKQSTPTPSPATPSATPSATPAAKPAAAPPAPAKKEPIKIGVMFSQTGRMASFETKQQKGALLALEERNAAGGINGQQLEPVINDAESDPEKALSKLKKMVAEDKVIAVVGPGTSYLHNPMIPAVDEQKTPNVVTSGGMHYITPIPKYSFSTETAPGFVMTDGIGKYWKKGGIKSVVLLTTSDSTGEGAVKEIKAMGEQWGIKVLGIEQRPGTDTEFTAAWTKLLANKPDAAFIYGTAPSFWVNALNNLADLGWDKPVGYAGGGRLPELLAGVSEKAAKLFQMAAMKSLRPDQLKDSDPMKPAVQKLATAYAKKYNGEAVGIGSGGYDAMNQVLDAIQAAGTDKEKIRTYLENLKDWKGAGTTYNRSATNHEGMKVEDTVIYGWDPVAKNFTILEYIE